MLFFFDKTYAAILKHKKKIFREKTKTRKTLSIHVILSFRGYTKTINHLLIANINNKIAQFAKRLNFSRGDRNARWF